MIGIVIDNEFASLIAPLTIDEYARLEQSIITEGCHDAIVVWQETNILLDGHNRITICDNHALAYNVRYKSFDSRHAAMIWIYDNQLGRRNLTNNYRTYIIGARYKLEKCQGMRTDLTSGHNDQKLTTAERIAEEMLGSERTIRRAEKYHAAVDLIAEHSEELKSSILAGDLKISKSETIQFGAVARKRPELATRAIDEMIAGNARSLRHGLALAGYSNEDASRSITINISSVERVALSLKRHLQSDEIERLIKLLGE